jgi:hypothetical protein
MLWDMQRERELGKRVFLQEKRRVARFYEVMFYLLAAMPAASLPLAWLLHGIEGVTGAWNVLATSICFIALAQWPRHFRRRAERLLREWEAALDRIAARLDSADRTPG